MRNNFTLLEVLVALIILTVGLAGLLGQFSIAANRCLHNMRRWEMTHELTQAAEYLLLSGPDSALDKDILSGEYRIVSRLEEAQLPAETQIKAWNFRLRTLVLTLSGKNGETEEWDLDCWMREDVNVH